MRLRSSFSSPPSSAFPYEVRFVSEEVGRGLFAVEETGAGTLLLAHVGSLRMSPAQWRAWRRRLGLPLDACLHHKRHVLVDPAFCLPDSPPPWYLLNHSSRRPNLRTILLDGRCVAWVAAKRIRPGDQLTYDYGSPSSHWGEPVA